MTHSGTRPARAQQRRRLRLGALAALALTAGCSGGIVGSTAEPIESTDEVVAIVLPEFDNTAPLITPSAPVAAPEVGIVAGGTAASDQFAVAVTFGSIQSNGASASGRFRAELGATPSNFDDSKAPSTTISR